MFIYITSDRTNIFKSGWKIVIQTIDNKIKEVPLWIIEWIVIFWKANLTVDVIRSCLKNKIPVFFLSKKWYYFWKLDSLEEYNTEFLYKQIKAFLDEEISLKYSKEIIYWKIHNCRVMLQRRWRFYENYNIEKHQKIVSKLKVYLNNIYNVKTKEELLWIEWIATKTYYEWFSLFIKYPFKFEWRVRRPPSDPVNSMLSLWYTLLAQIIQTILEIHKINPYIWFLHKPNSIRSLLVLDIMELFRSWIIDDLVIRLIHTEKIKEDMFMILEEWNVKNCIINDEWLEIFIKNYYTTVFKEKWDEFLKNNFLKIRYIEKTIEDLKKSLSEETYNYESFKIR